MDTTTEATRRVDLACRIRDGRLSDRELADLHHLVLTLGAHAGHIDTTDEYAVVASWRQVVAAYGHLLCGAS